MTEGCKPGGNRGQGRPPTAHFRKFVCGTDAVPRCRCHRVLGYYFERRLKSAFKLHAEDTARRAGLPPLQFHNVVCAFTVLPRWKPLKSRLERRDCP